MSSRELPTDRLATVDEFGDRIALYPAIVNGFFRKWRTRVHFVLILVFLLTPWTKLNNMQTVHLDILGRKFILFGQVFWAHDGPIIFFLLAGAVLTLAIMTALFGRVWCGWACPQTVFIDSVFRRIEVWTEGNHMERRQLDQAPMSGRKFLRKFAKWSLFTSASLIITHSFLAYFVGSDQLIQMVESSPFDNPIPFVFILFSTALILFDFSLFREQFCIIVCPYGRFQSVLLDTNSLSVAYDTDRGEPRKGSDALRNDPTQKQGDCINCYKCVAVCPTGVDIRRGLQLECIQCTACIDACDEVMEKIQKPKGLIRYASSAELVEKAKRKISLRVYIYGFLLALVISGLVYKISTRADIDASIVRSSDAPFTELAGFPDYVTNHYKLHIKNQILRKQEVTLRLAAADLARGMELVFPLNPIAFEEGETKQLHFFVKTPKSATGKFGHTYATLEFIDTTGEVVMTKSLTVLGPKLL